MSETTAPFNAEMSFLFYTFMLMMCLNSLFIGNAVAQIDTEPVATLADDYTFETIEVEGVDFLAVTSSSDFEDYGGYTQRADDGKTVGFTLIDGVFMTYDFPGAEETRFYALGNNGNAAGYYVDSEGRHRGVVLENGELRGYDFPDSVQTEIWGISDTTGKLTGNFIDASGVRRGFTGDEIIEVPGASETFADFINSQGGMVGSYVDAAGLYQPYIRTPGGRFVSLDLPRAPNLEYFFVHGINDAQTIVSRTKTLEGDLLTYVGRFQGGLQEFKVPGSVSTEGYNINQDGSIVGNYVLSDGRTHGFIARPAQDTDAPVAPEPVIATPDGLYTFESIDVPGVDFLALTASSDFEDYAGYTKSADGQKEVAFTLIDGVFTTYDFPGSQKTHFYALGNDGRAAGHYEDSDGLYHGVVLEDGVLRQYDFPGSVQTEIYGISDATGALTGNFIDAAGVRRGFSGDTIVEVPEASATYADFVNASGRLVGSYIDADGTYHPYVGTPEGRYISLDLPRAATYEYFFIHGINDAGILVGRSKRVGEIPRTAIGSLQHGLKQLEVPDSVITQGWNINQDGSIVGHYESADGGIHGFIARPEQDTAPQVDTEPVTTPTAAQISITPIDAPEDATYTFESIDVEGVQFLAVTSSSDYEDYGGYTRNADEKIVAFILIDGVFMTYDFPGAQETRFYALGNNGNAAGYYVDSEGHHRGVVLENGELRQYDFPDSVQTEIWGISDSTGALTGNFTDASGVRRGFTGDEIIEVPGASETFADFINSQGGMVGSYVDAEGLYHPYVRAPGGRFVSLDLPRADKLEYFFVHGINDAQTVVSRAKAVEGVPVTHVGTFQSGLQPFKVPDSVSTEGYNINQDGSIVGNYVAPDGRTHGFIARPAQDTDEPVPVSTDENHYTFETVDVPGTEILVLTASSDFEDYAGNARGADGQKEVGFTLIDGVFTTYDFPGSQNTYFYALGNDGRAAGHYEDSEGLHHGVVLENGELRQYDFPGSVQTELYGISDATGALTGNFIDASGVRRGFSGDTIVEVPGATETFADFVNANGTVVGSYIDAEGLYHPYYMRPDGRFITIDDPDRAANREYLFVHGINDAGSSITRVKLRDDVPRTYVGRVREGSIEVRFPGSVSTEGWNINQDGSIVGNYVSPDGRRHGFIARPASQAEAESYSNAYTVTLAKGLNMLSVPLAPPTPMTAKSLVALAGATTILTLDAAKQRFVAWTPGAPDDGFPIEGGEGYIVNVPQARNFAFVGSRWTNQTEAETPAAPVLSTEMPQEAWAFVVSGHLKGKPTFDGYHVSVRNLRTNSLITTSVRGDYFAAATADLARRSVVQAGDMVELRVLGPDGNLESQTLTFRVTPAHLANAVLSVKLEGIGQPQQNLLLQNYPNPFNPETWIPYQLSEDSPVSVSIYDTTGRLVRTLSLGFQSAGFYNSRGRAAYWDGRNELGERVASGVYFYQLTTPDFQQTRRLVILK